MADKLIIDCSTGQLVEQDFTEEERQRDEQQKLEVEQQAQLDLLKPSLEEIEKAEFELRTINLLTELGVI